ncbi:MAG: sugar phosphate isomerase/epimerase [Bryobacteraceae bacterium]|nr:sugar phosphate isomerase/epimerase [Bryobacteraceae bacterium]
MIRLCYTVATPDCEDPNMLALRGPLERSFALLAHAGYSAAELMVRDPQLLDARQIRRQASDAGLELPAVSTGQLRKERGLQLCALDPALRGAAVDALLCVVDFAAEIGAGVVNIGTLRGHLPAGSERRTARAAAARALETALAHAAAASIAIALEPQCRYVSNWLNTVGETLAFLHGFSGPRPRMVFDCYHALLEERSVAAALIRAFPHLAWVQVSDSNRGAPGSAQHNFGELIRVLKALGYEGYLSVECLPSADPAAAVQAAQRHLMPFLEENE